jgi:nicotinamide mononucleotide transporter
VLWVESIAVAFAIVYLVLAIRQNIWCWPAALISVLLSIWLFYAARLYMESALQVFYAYMAVYGWVQWRRNAQWRDRTAIHTWPLARHGAVIVLILVLTALFGWIMVGRGGAYPYWDSFTTIGAVVATYMVAHKVLENWIYWFVIDSVAMCLYGARELYLYAALFALYLVLVVLGFRAWRAEWRRQRPARRRAAIERAA